MDKVKIGYVWPYNICNTVTWKKQNYRRGRP